MPDKTDAKNWLTLLQKFEKSPLNSVIKYLPTSHPDYSESASKLFAFRAPDSYLERIDHTNQDDPLLRQILPLQAETNTTPGFSTDPLHETDFQPVPGILHKYHGRVLLIVTGACAIHCRYCFRRHFSYADNALSPAKLDPALEYLQSDTSIDEIILSGGDPIMLSNQRLDELIARLESIRHLQRLRIHTRIPVVDPDRINQELISLLEATRFSVVLVLHVNHAAELNDSACKAINNLRQTGMQLLNQSVLLRGINDNPDTLVELSKKLFDSGVLPYYLHMLDPVSGTAHFHVDDVTANKIITEVRDRLPGYLVPKLVREKPGETHKQIL